MLDTLRQEIVENLIKSGLSEKESLLAVNRPYKIPFYTCKDEMFDIIDSPFFDDFIKRFYPDEDTIIIKKSEYYHVIMKINGIFYKAQIPENIYKNIKSDKKYLKRWIKLFLSIGP